MWTCNNYTVRGAAGSSNRNDLYYLLDFFSSRDVVLGATPPPAALVPCDATDAPDG